MPHGQGYHAVVYEDALRCERLREQNVTLGEVPSELDWHVVQRPIGLAVVDFGDLPCVPVFPACERSDAIAGKVDRLCPLCSVAGLLLTHSGRTSAFGSIRQRLLNVFRRTTIIPPRCEHARH